MSSAHVNGWRTVAVFGTTCTAVLLLIMRRQERLKALWKKRISFKKISLRSDLGQCFGMDIGGTLTKLVYFEQKETTRFMRRPRSPSHTSAALEMTNFLIHPDHEKIGKKGFRDTWLTIESEELGGTLHFIHFETNNFENALNLVLNHGLNQTVHKLSCTGGGANKYASTVKKLVGIDFDHEDEVQTLIKGLNFILKLLPDEVYTFQNVDFKTLQATKVNIPRQNTDEDIFPYLLVSIGSGVSVLHVKSPSDYERVSGSSIGGGTYWGLCRLLTSCDSYDHALDLAMEGDSSKVDMSVGDIYGGSYDRFKLPASAVASSFGKMVMKEDPKSGVEDADFARALLIMVTQNIGQVAYLNSLLHKTKRIFFVGNFLRHNPISCRTLAFAIKFWSSGEMEAFFCKHEGYLGALGAFLSNVEDNNRCSNQEP